MAEFRIDQTGGAGAGVAGQSRFDLVPGVAVTLVATAPVGAGVSYAWEIIDAVNTTGTLSALTGTSVTIAAPGITQNSGFRVRLTADDNGNVTTVDRVFGVRSTYAGIRPPLFGEQAPATQRLGSNVPDLSTDNALYANLSGRGAPGQNPFGWREWGWELTQALEQVTDNLANLPPPPVSGNVFVYDSAATPVDNLYNSWAALYADAVLRESSVVIELRSDLTIPAGNYAMPPVIFRSTEFVSPGQAPTLTFDSAILTASSFGFERLDLEVTATTAASPLVCPSGFILLDFVNTNATPPGAAALLDVGPSDSVLVRAHGANIGPGSVFANLGANAVLFLYADDFISFDDGCFTGAASSALYLTANTASAGFGTIPQTMSLFAGTYSPYFLSRASNTFFDNGVVAPPLKGPSIPSIQDALDALKTLAYGNSFVVFSPSNPAPARNVYTTWADLHAAVSLLPWWARRVRVDNTYAVPTVAAGYWDVSFWQFVGPSSMADKLEYDAGGVTFALNTGVGLPLVPTLSFENLWTDYNGTSALITATTPVEIRAKDAEISVSGAGPFVDSTDVIVVRAKRSSFDSSGAISVFSSMIVTEMYAESTYIEAGCFGGAAATVQHDNAGNTVVPQTYLGAPLSEVRNTYAYYMFYDDSVPTLGATNVQDAIDALKTLAMYPTVGPVIWRDGAITQGNVFGSWSALYTYLSAAPAGQREVIVDNTLTTFPQIPAGTWNLSHWKIRGAIEWVPYLQINNGAYFTFDYNAGLTLENLWTNVLATTAPTITKAADSGIFKLTVIGGWIDVSGGTEPFFDGTSGTGNVNITIDNARLIGAQGVDSPDVPVLKFGASVIYNELILDRYADVYNPYALWSTDGNVTTKILSAAVNLPVQANYTSATYVNQELAYQVAYDDTLVNPLLSATDVQGAIDALKGLTTDKVPTTRTVSTTAPLAGGGALSGNLTLSITAATSSAAGSMSAADKTKLDGITAGAAVASVSGTAPITSSGGTTPAIGISAATTLAAGSMSASDKSKLDGIGSGATVASVGSGSTAISIGGTASVPTVAVAQDAAQGTTSTRKIATTTPSGIGGAAAAGTSTQAAAADHVHVLHETGGADLTLGAISDGQLLARSGTTIAGVVPGITSSTATRNNLRLANAYVASIGAVTLRAIAWNGSVYCAVGASGQCYTSPDGITWTSRSMGDSNTHTDIVWASSLGLFVAVGDGTSNAQGVVKTSPDGITWTSRVSAAAPPTNYSVAWSGSLLVTVGTSPISPTTSTIRTSPDGINWTQRTSSASVSLFAVVWNPVAGLFVAVGSTGTIVTSPDGITWTTRTSGTANNLYGLAVNPSTGRMVAVGATGTFITSSDGINWSATDTLYNAGTSNYALVTYGDGLFLVGPFNTGTGYWVSTDGIRWSSRIMSTGLTFGNALGGQRNCIFANNKWLWVGNGATYSDTVS